MYCYHERNIGYYTLKIPYKMLYKYQPIGVGIQYAHQPFGVEIQYIPIHVCLILF